jgi:hypothetical protein
VALLAFELLLTPSAEDLDEEVVEEAGLRGLRAP